MKVRASIVAIVTVAMGLFAPLAADPLGSVPTVERGVWCNDFLTAKAEADAQNVPMLILWANPGCTQCAKLEKACLTESFKAWQAERQLIMAFGYDTKTESDKACKEFVKNSSKAYPYMGVYWKSNSIGEPVLELFTGRAGTIGHGANSKDTLEDQLMTAVDTILADWDPTPAPDPEPIREGGSFLVPDTEGSHLESIAGVTESVMVPLVRTEAGCVVTNVFTAGATSRTLVWQVGEKAMSVPVDTSSLAVGETLEMTLMLEGEVVETTAIHGVAQTENAPKNPKFLGDAFGYGEWTVDYEAAKSYVNAHPGSRLLALFSGPLWCPYCIGMEDTLLTTPEFRQWAKDNQVVLVLMEQGRASSPATALGQRGPRLTTYEPDPNKLAKGEIVSGAAYRSRTGVTEAEANDLINQAAAYTARWLEPGSTAARLGNPTILLIDPQTESVQARLNGYRVDVAGVHTYPVEENLARLDALLVQDPACEGDKYPQTTTRTHDVGLTSSFDLQVNAASVSYQIATRVGLVSLNAEPADGSTCTMSVTAGGRTLASGTNTVSFVATPDDVTEGVAVRIFRTFAEGERTVFGLLTSSWQPVDVENEFVKSVFKTEMALSVGGQAAGTLALSNSKKGKTTIKYVDLTTQKTVSLSGYWSEPDEIGTAELVAEKYKGELSVRLELTGAGVLTATLVDRRDDPEVLELTGCVSVAPCDYATYYGLYTVVFPVQTRDEIQSFGAGYAIIKANTPAFKSKGKVSATVVFPNGVSKTVSGQLVSGPDEFAYLTLTAKSGTEAFVLPLAIRPHALLAPTHRAITAQTGTAASWLSKDKKRPFAIACEVYGSRYERDESLLDCCGTTGLVLSFDPQDLTIGDKAVALASVTGDGAAITVTERKLALAAKTKGLTLSCSRATGIVSGKTQLVLANGKKVAARLKGVLAHDWHDCGCFDEDEGVPLTKDRPTVYGMCTFSDRIGGKPVTRGFPFALEPKD